MQVAKKVALVGLVMLAVSGVASAQGEAGAAWAGPSAGLALLGAGVVLGLAAIGTGIAQYGIGAAVVGAVAEDPKFLGRGFILLAFVETILIFGFVGLILVSGKLPA
jgi:V/A-type H+-transporting ATPase subunit K